MQYDEQKYPFVDGQANKFLMKGSQERLAANRVFLCTSTIFVLQYNRDMIKLVRNKILAVPEYDDMISRSGFSSVIRY